MMTPLRNIDRLIMENLFGEQVVETDDCNGIDNYWIKGSDEGLPFFSSQDEDALRLFTTIADHIRSNGVATNIVIEAGPDGWICKMGLDHVSDYSLAMAITQCVIKYFRIKEDENEYKVNNSSRRRLSLLRRFN